jgi:hypothetical protein
MSKTDSKKLCRTCNSFLPDSSFYKAHQSCCKECYKAKEKANRHGLDAMPERACSKCSIVKPSDQYYSGSRYCKDCQNKNTNANRARRAAERKSGAHCKCSQCKVVKPPEAFGNGGNTYCLECDSEVKAAITYKISRAQVRELRSKPKCEICKKEFQLAKDRNIDHCHESGKIRGVLCYRCNTGIGLFGDDTGILMSAIRYLSDSIAKP